MLPFGVNCWALCLDVGNTNELLKFFLEKILLVLVFCRVLWRTEWRHLLWSGHLVEWPVEAQKTNMEYAVRTVSQSLVASLLLYYYIWSCFSLFHHLWLILVICNERLVENEKFAIALQLHIYWLARLPNIISFASGLLCRLPLTSALTSAQVCLLQLVLSHSTTHRCQSKTLLEMLEMDSKWVADIFLVYLAFRLTIKWTFSLYLMNEVIYVKHSRFAHN